MKKKHFFLSTPILILGAFFFLYHLKPCPHNEALFPIDFISYTKQPTAEVMIEGQKYPLLIDLGSDSHLTLRTEILNKIQKTQLKDVRSFDIKGNEYISKAYLLPKIKFKNASFTKVKAVDEGEDFLKGAHLYGDSDKSKDEENKDKAGRVGRDLFIDVDANLFLDFHNSIMFICCHLADRKKDGYRIAKFVSAPFELNESGIILDIDTDIGVKRFMLDTGCTRSLLKPSVTEDLESTEWKPGIPLWHSSKFSFGGRDFGGLDFLLIEIAPVFPKIDGMIGMDFLKEHAVYIDFQKKRAYIAKSDECLPAEKISWLETCKDYFSEMKLRVQESLSGRN